MVKMTWEKQCEIQDFINDCCYLLGLHIETNINEIVIERDEDYIVEALDVIIPKTKNETRNKHIEKYINDELSYRYDLILCKKDKKCFNKKIYIHLYFME